MDKDDKMKKDKLFREYVISELEWVKKNLVWAGAKVKVIKPFAKDEGGCRCIGSDSIISPAIVGEVFTVKNVAPGGINLLCGNMQCSEVRWATDWFTAPYSALEVVEPVDKTVFDSEDYRAHETAFVAYVEDIV